MSNAARDMLPTSHRWSAMATLPDTNVMQKGTCWNHSISTSATASPRTASTIFSMTIPALRLATEAPITLRVLMPRMRMGVSAKVKLVRLSMATISTKMEATSRTICKLRLPLSSGPMSEKCISLTGLSLALKLPSRSNFSKSVYGEKDIIFMAMLFSTSALTAASSRRKKIV